MNVAHLPFSKEHERREKQSLILGKAAELFNASGVRSTRYQDVSAAIGLTKTSVSYYYDTKEKLAVACYSRSCDILKACAEAAEGESTGLKKILGLISAYGGYWRDIGEQLRLPIVKMKYMPALSEEAKAEIATAYSPITQFILDAFEAGQADGSIRKLNKRDILGYINNMLQSVADIPFQGISADSATKLSEYLEIIRVGIRTNRRELDLLHTDTMPMPINTLGIFDRETRNQFKRDAFVAAAIRKFNAKGVDGVGMNEIAKELGVTRGAFYYHFADKETLLEACFEQGLAYIEETYNEQCAAAPDGASVIGETLLNILSRNTLGTPPTIYFRLLRHLPSQGRARIQARLDRLASQFGIAVIRGEADGSLRSCDPQIIERAMMALIQAPQSSEFLTQNKKDAPLRTSSPGRLPSVHANAFLIGLAAT